MYAFGAFDEASRGADAARRPPRRRSLAPPTVPITVRLQPTLKRQLDEHAKTLGLATGTYVRSLIENALQEGANPDGKLT